MLQIVWKQKHQREHGTCDKKILTPPSIRMSPSLQFLDAIASLGVGLSVTKIVKKSDGLKVLND